MLFNVLTHICLRSIQNISSAIHDTFIDVYDVDYLYLYMYAGAKHSHLAKHKHYLILVQQLHLGRL
jgi:hypothetical protein